MTLAKTYLECGEPKLSLKCLFQSKEFRLCAELCKKLGKVLHPYSAIMLSSFIFLQLFFPSNLVLVRPYRIFKGDLFQSS